MRWKAKKIDDRSLWHHWFAWHPVQIDNEWVWLEKVERKVQCFWDDWYWNYRNISDGESS